MAAKTDPINTSNPAGDSDPKQGDDYIRTLAKALIELLTVDHYVGVANPWGNDASGDETGEHARVMFHEAISDPSVDAGKGALFIKGSPPELYFRDEDDGDVIQLTNGGIVNLTSAALLGILAKNTYFTAVNNAEDGTVNLIKAGTNDLATLPDSAEMASNAAPVEDEAIANKKYVDDKIAIGVYARLYRGTDQAIGTSTWTKVELSSESFDSASIGNTGTYRITPDAAGYYQVNAMVGWTDGASDKYFRGAVRKNGSVIMINVGNDYGNAPQGNAVSDVVYFNGSTDYIELWAITQDAGQNVKGGSEYTYLSVCKMPS